MSEESSLRRASGRLGERLAAWFLERRGYRVRERNARVGRFEVDLVAERGPWLVFVEVKRRGGSAWARAARTLGPAQRRRLAAAAEAYAARAGGGRPVRFDVVTVDEDARRLVIEHHPDCLGGGGELR
jgi:putative endonuclease